MSRGLSIGDLVHLCYTVYTEQDKTYYGIIVFILSNSRPRYDVEWSPDIQKKKIKIGKSFFPM